MSGELEIPDRAWREFGSSMAYVEILDVKAAARIIVAEAFRKRAHEVEARAVRVRGNNPATVTESLIAQAQQLRDDADELDPPAVNP